jgi:hypothetical protein
MTTSLMTIVAGLLFAVPVIGQEPQVPGGRVTRAVTQPVPWVAFHAVVERDGVEIGQFWRDDKGSTRLELFAPDAEGHTILIQNIPTAIYYAYRPATGWTAQPMLLPSTGWHPQPVAVAEAGTTAREAVEGLPTRERLTVEGLALRAAALNFFPLVRQLADGTVERHRRVQIGAVSGRLFVPPDGAVVVPLADPGGIVARPAQQGGAR